MEYEIRDEIQYRLARIKRSLEDEYIFVEKCVKGPILDRYRSELNKEINLVNELLMLIQTSN